LKKNVNRIVHIANQILKDNKPQLFKSIIVKILDELENQLDVSGDEVSGFNSSIKELKKRLPENGALLPYSNNTSFQILDAALLAAHSKSRVELKHDISQLKCRLKDLLRVEREKDPNANSTEKTKDSYGFADSLLNFEAMSSMSAAAGAESLGDERVQRITKVIAELEKGEPLLNQNSFVFIDEVLKSNKNVDWENLFCNTTISNYETGTGCTQVTDSFNKNISSWTQLYVAMRVGQLEFDSEYQSEVHDDYFEHFTWSNFSTEELNNCPHFVLIADDIELFETELSKLSAVLSNNIPVKIVAVKRDNFGGDSIHSQTELGALMLSHKNIFVAQSTSITPKYLFKGFVSGLNSFAPAFFNILNVDETAHKNPYLWTSASVESRDFPGFTFNGVLGTSWGSRFEMENNPQTHEKCPLYELAIVNGEGDNIKMEFPFTFADQAVLNPANHKYFMKVDGTFWGDNLIPLTDYMESGVEENVGKIPFIWMMDAGNELHKIAVSWPIVLATQERLDFWRFLQESSGINNYHVTNAVNEAKAIMQLQHDEEIEKLKEGQNAEIELIRLEESGKVMENLTSVLLNLDTSNIITTTAVPTSSSSATAKDEISDVPAESAPVEEESMLSNDPYIDTALCTSCNECINLNGQLFNYNGDKMAFIADPKAGSFKDLVEAAELCPVSVIHPGAPLDSNEPDLEDLVQRAEKFN